MVYKVIGLMSGSSLDGLDIVYVHLDENRGSWKYNILAADCVKYNEDWIEELKNAKNKSVADFLKLNTRYGNYLADCVNDFIEKNMLHHKVDFIASHGHTVFHEPENHTSTQIGCGATLAAHTQLPVINDLRSMDVALGGQGAPIVPVGDKLLFAEHDYWLNIGGIVNITVRNGDDVNAFDVCTGNQTLNILAQREGKEMDENGDMARQGLVLTGVLSELNDQDYFQKTPPKSLSNEAAIQLVFPVLMESKHANADLLRTVVQHIAEQVSNIVKQRTPHHDKSTMLITGGGAFNSFLVETIQELITPFNVTAIVPEAQTVMYKEALVMALIGALRWREETNVLSSVTGASRNTISGALWMGQG